MKFIFCAVALFMLFSLTATSRADDWPMRGKNVFRQSWAESGTSPHDWKYKVTARDSFPSSSTHVAVARRGQIKWIAGGFWQAMCDPVVAHGLLWIGTADPIGESKQDSSVLACFDAKTGKLLYQHVSEKLGVARQDWPGTGNTSSPFIEGNRLWFCTNRLEVICLNIQPLIDRSGDPAVLWNVDLKTRFNIVPKDVHLGNRASRCSIVGVDGRIFVNTTHSFEYGNKLDAEAPSLICLDQNTGETIWTDSSPGKNIARNQHCNPVIFQHNEQKFVAIGQGDGYVRAFESDTGKMVWQFDLNTQQARRKFGSDAFRATKLLTESPVFDGRYLYFIIGDDREAGNGTGGGIFCIDPFGQGDVSRDISVEDQLQLNSNSKLIWEYSNTAEEPILTSIAGLCLTDTYLFAAATDGIVRCFDKLNGKQHWQHDMNANVIGTPLVVGDTLYVADEDGDIEVMRADAKYELIGEMNHESPIDSSPIYADDTLFMVTRQEVIAVGK